MDAASSNASYPWYAYRTEITSVVFQNGVTSVANNAFAKGYSSLQQVDIPASLTSFPEPANAPFAGDTLLSTVIFRTGKIPANACANMQSLTTVKDMSYTVDGITEIGNYAFSGCKALSSIPGEDSVKTIGDYAFNGCEALVTADLKKVQTLGKYAFYQCKKLTRVVLNDSMTQIPEWAFGQCAVLSQVNLPTDLKSIDKYGFYACRALQQVTLPNGLESIGDYAFEQCSLLDQIELPASVTSLGTRVFYSCYALSDIKLPNTLIAIPYNMFGYCTSLEQIELPSNLITIDREAFKGCSSLKKVTFPDSLQYIGDSAFESCAFEDAPEFPENLTTLGSKAFCNCKKLKSIKLPENITSTSSYLLQGCSALTKIEFPNGFKTIGGGTFSNCTSLKTIELPDTLTGIFNEAFDSCTSLTGIEFPQSLNSISPYSFRNCTSLTQIVVPSGNTGVGECTFYGCTSLKRVTVSENVHEIGNYAFYNCSALESISSLKSVKKIGKYAFYNCSALGDFGFSEDLTKVGEYAFCKCAKLTSIQLPSKVYEIGEHSFDLCTSVKSIDLSETKITTIPSWAFSGCKGANRVVLPKELISIKSGAFNECYALNYVSLPDTLQTLESRAFSYDTKLNNIRIPQSLRFTSASVEGAFMGCSGLKNITFEGANYSIPDYLFAGCTGIETIKLPKEVLVIGEKAFYGCSNLKQISMPSALKEIGTSAFEQCIGLQKIELPDSCSVIGTCAFQGCKVLSEVSFGNGLGQILSSAFYNCNLQTLVLPNSLHTIETKAFCQNPNLTSVTIPGNVTSVVNGIMNQSSAVIIGEKGSAAESFAGKKGYTFVEGDPVTEAFIEESEDLSLGVGETVYRTLQVDSKDCVSGVKWVMGDDAIATVSKVEGKTYEASVTGKAKGETTLTVICGEFTYTWNIVVEKRPIQISFLSRNYYLDAVNQTYTVTYSSEPANMRLKNPVYTSSDPLVAEVNEKGLVTAKSGGVVRIVLKDAVTGVSDYCYVYVKVPEVLHSISFDQKELYVAKDPMLLTYRTDPIRYKRDQISYSVNKEGIITISQSADGLLVSAEKEGTVTVTISDTEGTLSDTCIIHADPNGKAVSKIVLNKTYVNTDEIGVPFTLEASVEPSDAISSDVTWTSSDPSVAYVDKNGIVTPLRGGDVMIYATSKNGGLSTGCRVVITCPVKNLTLCKDELTLSVGQEYRLDAVVYPYICSDPTLKWTVIDPAVAKVDRNGVVTGLKEGTTRVECETRDGSNLTAVCNVIVVSGENTISEETTKSYQEALQEYGQDQETYQERQDDALAGNPVTPIPPDEEEIITLPKPIEESEEKPSQSSKTEQSVPSGAESAQKTEKDQQTVSQNKLPVVISQEDPDPRESTKIGACKLKKVKKQKNKLKLTWKKVKNVDGYEIRYAANKKLKKSKKVNVKGQKTKITIAKAKGKTIYVKIRAYKTVSGVKIYGAWSKVKKAAGK
ncbi:MAG: leucine-rich repeat protein [Lachnospiraceae bacterium]|nr:leucine-rich repeat protein [Lachnospiraceae bacterium]